MNTNLAKVRSYVLKIREADGTDAEQTEVITKIVRESFMEGYAQGQRSILSLMHPYEREIAECYQPL